MRKWIGMADVVSLPKTVEEQLRQRTANILNRHGYRDRFDIVQELVDEVSFAFAGSNHELKRNGRGRPVDGPEKLLAVIIGDVLMKHGIRGNWVGIGDQEEDGEIGIVAELESIAQSAYRQSQGKDPGTICRPARITEGRKILGKVFRNAPMPKFDPNN
jgi:hypothetical protein